MRQIWLLTGFLFMGLGIVGIALPIMPTVPFLLVAAWAFSRSSPRLRQKILDHPAYGPPIRAWHERGAIGGVAKIWAVVAMAGGIALALWLALPVWIIVAQAAICAGVAAYIVTRPG
jgi:uncharacterized membrane protein YbaN (DUF454 family)